MKTYTSSSKVKNKLFLETYHRVCFPASIYTHHCAFLPSLERLRREHPVPACDAGAFMTIGQELCGEILPLRDQYCGKCHTLLTFEPGAAQTAATPSLCRH
ncbi:unnamed protein product [Tilletia controversa]|nr:unnamed protein product [Tilletia controversa]